MIQRLGEQMGINGERAVIAALVAALVGICYAAVVHWAYTHDPDHPYTFVAVVFGTALTLGAALIVVPAVWVGLVALLFAITGAPQILAAILRAEQDRHAAKRAFDAELKRNVEDALQ